MGNGVWLLILVTSWCCLSWDHLVLSQLLLLLREQQLGQGLVPVWIAASLLWRVRELSWGDIGCALQYFPSDHSLAHFISQCRYIHLVCICGVCFSAWTKVTYFETGWWRKKRKHNTKCGWVLCDPEPSPTLRWGIFFHEGTWFSAYAVSVPSRDRPKHVIL